MSNDSRFCSGSPLAATNDTYDTICAYTEECQRIVDEAILKFISGLAFLEWLEGAGVTPNEAWHYIEQYTQHRRDQEVTESADDPSASVQPDLNVANLVDTATSIAWALLCAMVNHFQLTSSQATSIPGNSLSDELASLLGLSSSKGAIPASVLSAWKSSLVPVFTLLEGRPGLEPILTF